MKKALDDKAHSDSIVSDGWLGLIENGSHLET